MRRWRRCGGGLSFPRAGQPLDRVTAQEHTSWCKVLADATRIQIVSLLARRGQPISVGAIVDAVQVGQSTVSVQLEQLVEVSVVLVEKASMAGYYRVNGECVTCIPSAAAIAMGDPAPAVRSYIHAKGDRHAQPPATGASLR